MQRILEAEAAGDPDAALGVAVYLHRLRAGIAAMTASMGGLDVLVFTGGVGEHSPAIRERAAHGLAFLGVRVDPEANSTADPDCDITAPAGVVRTYAVRAREDLEVARGVRTALADPPAAGSTPAPG
jgi:acetate kinase